MSRVLIVEDDEVIAQGMARHLTAAGFDPVCVNRGDTGLQRLRFENTTVCILDLMVPGVDGWRFLETARAEGVGTPIVVVSARGTEHEPSGCWARFPVVPITGWRKRPRIATPTCE